MTYVVDEKCIKCKHMDCVEVCPVDCFYEGESYVSHTPDECIDCGVCDECPVEGNLPDTEDGIENGLKLMKVWNLANVSEKTSSDADKWQNVDDSFCHFSDKPGK